MGYSPIGYLRIQPGFACLEADCGYAARSSEQIYRHSRKTHPNNTGHRSTSIQTLFDCPCSHCFEVEPPSSILHQSFIESMSAEGELCDQERKEAGFLVSYSPREDMYPWLYVTRFLAHLADIDMRQPIARTIIPDRQLQQSGEISALVDCVETIFGDIQYATYGVPQDILEWLASDSSTDPSSHPFIQDLPEHFTWNRCVSWWSRFFVYIYSVYTDIQKDKCDAILQRRFEESFDLYTWGAMRDMFLFIDDNDPGDLDPDDDLRSLMMTFIMRVLEQR
jgi:hypothetical protein